MKILTVTTISGLAIIILLLGNQITRGQVLLSVEEVTFRNGEITLAGRLYLPSGNKPCPAVVFTHGSGDSGRDNPRYKEEVEYFAKFGIASLLYDKRGYGASKGDWRRATFEDLAGDAVTAVAFLKSRPEIDRLKIGLRGASQSGWVLPIAAVRSSDIAQLILISPPGVTPYEQILYDVRTDLEDAGFAPADVEAALALTRLGLDCVRSRKGWKTYKAALEKTKDKAWFSIASGPPDPDHWLWHWIQPVIDFDAVPLFKKVKIPVLVILGEDDREIPSQIAGYRLEKVLSERGGTFLIRYFPHADHDLRLSVGQTKGTRPPLAEGYLETMKDWILQPSNAAARGQTGLR